LTLIQCCLHAVLVLSESCRNVLAMLVQEEDKGMRLAVLEKLANICRDQGSFALACKKFTQVPTYTGVTFLP
jgi:hypothetical protein